jgi:hypothetical protein
MSKKKRKNFHGTLCELIQGLENSLHSMQPIPMGSGTGDPRKMDTILQFLKFFFSRMDLIGYLKVNSFIVLLQMFGDVLLQMVGDVLLQLFDDVLLQ